MPEDGLDLVAGTAVVQTVLCSCVDERESATPQRCSATPRAVDAVLHIQTVLDHISIRPDGLVLISGQLEVLFGDNLRIPIIVGCGLPRRTVTGCTTNLIKDLFTSLNLRIL